MISDRTFARTTSACFLIFGLSACTRTYVPIAKDFGVCVKSHNVGVFNISKGIDFDDGTVVRERIVFDVYVGGNPDLNGITNMRIPNSNEIELLYSGMVKGEDRVVGVYGYANKADSKTNVPGPIFVKISSKNSSTSTMAVLSSIGSNLVRCR